MLTIKNDITYLTRIKKRGALMKPSPTPPLLPPIAPCLPHPPPCYTPYPLSIPLYPRTVEKAPSLPEAFVLLALSLIGDYHV